MSIQIPGVFEKIFSDHPHRRIRVFLLVIFVLLVVIGSFYAFDSGTLVPRKVVDPLAKEKAQAILDLKERLSTSPSISQAERDKALLDLQARLKVEKKK